MNQEEKEALRLFKDKVDNNVGSTEYITRATQELFTLLNEIGDKLPSDLGFKVGFKKGIGHNMKMPIALELYGYEFLIDKDKAEQPIAISYIGKKRNKPHVKSAKLIYSKDNGKLQWYLEQEDSKVLLSTTTLLNTLTTLIGE